MLKDTGGFIYIPNGAGTPPNITLNDDIYPFTEQLDIVLDDPRVDKSKVIPNADGMYNVTPQLGGMSITAEGMIIGEDSADYLTKRTNLVSILRNQNPSTPTLPPVRNRDNGDGFLQLDLVGSSELWDTPFNLYVMAFSAPLVAGDAAMSKFMLTLWSNAPYFVGDDTGNIYWYS